MLTSQSNHRETTLKKWAIKLSDTTFVRFCFSLVQTSHKQIHNIIFVSSICINKFHSCVKYVGFPCLHWPHSDLQTEAFFFFFFTPILCSQIILAYSFIMLNAIYLFLIFSLLIESQLLLSFSTSTHCSDMFLPNTIKYSNTIWKGTITLHFQTQTLHLLLYTKYPLSCSSWALWYAPYHRAQRPYSLGLWLVILHQ